MAAITPFHIDATWCPDLTVSAGTITIYVDDTACSSTLPVPPAPDPEDDLKALLREQNRQRALEAQRWMSTFRHTRRPAPAPEGVAARPPRPTCRRTATATKNWRRP